VPLVRQKVEELARDGIDRVAAGLDANRAGDDEQEGGLLHLVLAQLLPRLERDQDDATLAVLGMQDDGRSRTVGRLDLIQLPVLHARRLTAAGKSYTSASLDSPT
jgi:hypothetical protein